MEQPATPTPERSLISGPEQMPLLSQEAQDVGFLQDHELPRNPTFTAERFQKIHPEKYKLCVAALAMGLSPNAIFRTGICARSTAIAVREHEQQSGTFKGFRDEAIADYRRLLKLGHERLRDILEDGNVDLRDVVYMIDKIGERYQLLTGGATGRVEHTDGTLTHEEFLLMLDSLRKDASTRLGGGKFGVGGAEASAAGMDQARDVTDLVEVSRPKLTPDKVSVDSTQDDQQKRGNDA